MIKRKRRLREIETNWRNREIERIKRRRGSKSVTKTTYSYSVL
jgi:hypothetical protein